jgi:integrase
VKIDRWWRGDSWPPNLFRRQRSQNFYVRADWPKDVQPFVGGQKQYRKSLGTANYREAVARLKTMVGSFQDECNRLRVENGAEAKEARQRAQYLTLAYRGQLNQAVMPPPGRDAVNAALLSVDDFQAKLRNGLLQANITVWDDDTESPEEITLPPHWEESIHDLLKRLIREDAAAAQPAPSQEPGSDGRSSLSAVLKMLQQERQFTPRTLMEYETAIDRFEEVNERKTIDKITKEDGTRFKQKLLELGLAPASKAKQIGFLKSLLTYAADSLMIPANPLAGLKADAGKRSISSKREDFSPSDLHALFIGEPKGTERWWVMRLALFTGMRVGEIVQLTAMDVFQNGDSWFISVNSEDGKALKTRNSRRIVPVHKQLIADGFVSFVPANGRLFPSVNSAPGRAVGAVFSQWFTHYRRACGISSDTKVFHSFRHSFKAAAREARIPEDLSDALTGHANPNIGRQYGNKIGRRDATDFLAMLKQEIDRVEFHFDSGVPSESVSSLQMRKKKRKLSRLPGTEFTG